MLHQSKLTFSKMLFGFAIAILFAACGSKPSPGDTTNASPAIPSKPPVASTNSEQGGVDGGGGSYVGSSPEQIKAIFNGDNGFNLKETVNDVFKTIAFQVTNKTISPELENIFSRMLGSNFSGDPFDVFKDIEKSNYDLKPEGECLDGPPGEFKYASTKIDKKESPICFSLEGLKRLPIQAVPFQIVALAVHEHAHHYGFNESDALKAQQHVLNTMNQSLLGEVFIETLSAGAFVRDQSTKLLNNLGSDFSDKLICLHLSSINSATEKLLRLSAKIEHQFELRMLVTALDFKFGLTKKSLSGVDELYNFSSGTLGFCGDDPISNPGGVSRVDAGNRSKLRDSLGHIRSLAHQIVLQATSLSNQKRN